LGYIKQDKPGDNQVEAQGNGVKEEMVYEKGKRRHQLKKIIRQPFSHFGQLQSWTLPTTYLPSASNMMDSVENQMARR